LFAVWNSVTRGNTYKLRQSHCKYELQRHVFTNRIVAIWNSFPYYVVDAHSVNVFKNNLNRHDANKNYFIRPLARSKFREAIEGGNCNM